MSKYHVVVACDVHCQWEDTPPIYRLWVEDELFAERTYIWKKQYLEELIQIYAPLGKYNIRYEIINSKRAKITPKNLKIINGPPGTTVEEETIVRIGNDTE